MCLKITMFVFWFLLLLESLAASPQQRENCIVKHQHHLKCRWHYPTGKYSNEVEILELQEIQGDVIDVNVILENFPNVQSISLTNSKISKFTRPNNKTNEIKILELKHVEVENLPSNFLNSFPNLEMLNLQENLLQNIKNNFSTGSLKNLLLSGNRWNCSMDQDWVYKVDRKILGDLENLTCFGEPHAGKPLLVIAKLVKEMKNQCPFPCVCTLPKVVSLPESDNLLEPLVEVNCSYRGLAQLPSTLPENARILRVEGNEIEDLGPLINNPSYRRITDLYLDDNKVKSIEELEGSYWLRHFRVFSLSGNKLSELPTYALDNALDQNRNMPVAIRINLGGNPWRCDCVFTPVFQEMLQKFAPQIGDMSKVKCSYVEGDENSLLPIIEISRSSVCRLQTEYSVQALDLLNGVLASLIILILGKLAYDYYYFKKTGRLPWIVTKMP